MPKRLPLQHPDNRPHYTFIYSCPSGCYTPMRNAVEPQNTESAAPYCPQRFSRKDPCDRQSYKYSFPSSCLYSTQITDLIIHSFIHAQVVAILLCEMLWNHRTPSQLPHTAHRDSREKIHVIALHLHEEHCGKEKPTPLVVLALSK